jgi:hypothetical protein
MTYQLFEQLSHFWENWWSSYGRTEKTGKGLDDCFDSLLFLWSLLNSIPKNTEQREVTELIKNMSDSH